VDSDERLRTVAHDLGVDPDQHCCPTMAARVALARQARSDLPVVVWIPMWNEYLVPVAGGPLVDLAGEWNRQPMSFCPWCGAKLPMSLSKEWHERLRALGYDDPGNNPHLPQEFESDAWWRSQP
jgi:hypothetical protein